MGRRLFEVSLTVRVLVLAESPAEACDAADRAGALRAEVRRSPGRPARLAGKRELRAELAAGKLPRGYRPASVVYAVPDPHSAWSEPTSAAEAARESAETLLAGEDVPGQIKMW